VNEYEAMVIFQEALSEEGIEKGIEEFKVTLVKLGGEVATVTRMGRKVFARKMDKSTAGEYALIRFSMDPARTNSIREELRRSEYLFRLNIMKQSAVAAQ